MKNLNILFITQDDPFYVRIFFEEFLKNCKRPSEIKGVVIAPAMGKKSFGRLLSQMYGFYGPVDFTRVGLKYVACKAAAASAGLLRIKSTGTLKGLCESYGIPVINASNINSDEFLREIALLRLDLVISVAAPQIFKEKLISLPSKGCINIHNSKLPKYRGMLPNFWQMYHGEKTVGTTVHYINAGLDDGDILVQKETPIVPGESLDSLIRKTKKFGASVMMEAIDGIRKGNLKPKPNAKENSTYFTFPTKAEVSEFRKRGYRLL